VLAFSAMPAASSNLDMVKSIESVDTWKSLRDSDDPGSYTHSSAGIESLSTTDGDGLRDPWDDCDLEVDVADDDFFVLLKSEELCPPALKESRVKSGWQNLVEFVRTAYENYLTSKEYEARTVNLTVSQQFQR
jgi:hypothetical protein